MGFKYTFYFCKAFLDYFLSLIILIFISPLILICILVVFINDGGSPFYISKRVGYKGHIFKIYKIRTMVINADKIGGTSTKNSDSRLLPIGKLIRKLKLDELAQLINVINSSMSLVGPRPNTPIDVSNYSSLEMKLLDVKPGITDFSSIIFADEGSILDSYKDPDLAYNQLIRPWKSKLGLFYISNADLYTDLSLMMITFINIFDRRRALNLISKLIKKKGGSTELIKLSKRLDPLMPSPPPGFNEPITKLNINGN